jgi:hypothetical protein
MAETAVVFGVSNSTLPSLSLRRVTVYRSNTPTITRSFHADLPSFPYLTLSNSHSQLSVVSSDSKTTSFDLSAPDLDTTGGGGDIKGNGDDFGGGGAVEKEEVVTIVARVRKDQTVTRRRWLCQCLRN